jgi:hypothetical protein
LPLLHFHPSSWEARREICSRDVKFRCREGIEKGEKFGSKFMQNLVISNYTGRYTTIHRRKRPSDKRKPPTINLAVLSEDAFCLFAAATHLSSLRNKYGNLNPD